MKGVAQTDALYLASREQLRGVLGGMDPKSTPVAIAEYGYGLLCHIGDVNGEEGSTKAILAMLELAMRRAEDPDLPRAAIEELV